LSYQFRLRRNYIEDTAVPFLAPCIVGKRQCRILISGDINSDGTEIDITGLVQRATLQAVELSLAESLFLSVWYLTIYCS
jgi:hypothetical protein